MKKFFHPIFFLIIAGSIFADLAFAGSELDYNSQSRLTPQQIERVKACKQLLEGADQKSLETSIEGVESSPHPEENLQIMEAMAKTFSEIALEYKVESQKKKEWLYSMVELNMAYLQLEGAQGGAGVRDALNKLICRKLKEYLPARLLKNPGLFYSVE